MVYLHSEVGLQGSIRHATLTHQGKDCLRGDTRKFT